MHPLQRIISFLYLLLAFGSTASAGIMHPESVTPGQVYLDYGAQTQFSSVAGLFGIDADGTSHWLGSSTVIDEHWVMAGAHNALVGNFDHYSIRTGTNLNSSLAEGIFFSSTFAVQDPSYTEIGQGRDIALIRFDAPITGVTPAQLYTGTVGLGETVSMAGFGGSAVVGEAITFDFEKRGYQNIVSNFGRTFFTPDYIGYTFEGPGATNFLALGGLLWNGDSGGGWFIESGGEYKLAGISSSTFLINDYASPSFASTFDIDWVNSYVGQTASVPEPGSLALFSIGFVILGVKNRRKHANQVVA